MERQLPCISTNRQCLLKCAICRTEMQEQRTRMLVLICARIKNYKCLFMRKRRQEARLCTTEILLVLSDLEVISHKIIMSTKFRCRLLPPARMITTAKMPRKQFG